MKQLSDNLEEPQLFKKKILLYGDTKLGKTTFVSTFTKGPIHFDFFDPGGKGAVIKAIREGRRPSSEGISFEEYDHSSKLAFNQYWKNLQKMEKDGFFLDLSKRNGIYCIDSYTTLNLATMALTMSVSPNSLPSQPDFRVNKGHIMNWLGQITGALPCAVVVIAHTEISKDEASGSIKILPLVTGSLKTSTGVYFDDLLFMKLSGTERVICARPSAKANAGSSVLPQADLKDITMDDYFEHFSTGKCEKILKQIKPSASAAKG